MSKAKGRVLVAIGKPIGRPIWLMTRQLLFLWLIKLMV